MILCAVVADTRCTSHNHTRNMLSCVLAFKLSTHTHTPSPRTYTHLAREVAVNVRGVIRLHTQGINTHTHTGNTHTHTGNLGGCQQGRVKAAVHAHPAATSLPPRFYVHNRHNNSSCRVNCGLQPLLVDAKHHYTHEASTLAVYVVPGIRTPLPNLN